MRTESSRKADVLKKTNEVYVLESGEEWSRVMTSEGYVGYAENADLSETSQLAFTQNGIFIADP